jgi:hypothetical protein
MTFESEARDSIRAVRMRLWGAPPTVEQAPRYIRPPEPPEPSAPVLLPVLEPDDFAALLDEADERSWKEGFNFILKSYGENMRRLVSYQRDQHIVSCRIAIAIYLRNRGWSYPRIGAAMHRDHSSIIHLLEPQRKRDAYLKRQAESVKRQRAANGRKSRSKGLADPAK